MKTRRSSVVSPANASTSATTLVIEPSQNLTFRCPSEEPRTFHTFLTRGSTGKTCELGTVASVTANEGSGNARLPPETRSRSFFQEDGAFEREARVVN